MTVPTFDGGRVTDTLDELAAQSPAAADTTSIAWVPAAARSRTGPEVPGPLKITVPPASLTVVADEGQVAVTLRRSPPTRWLNVW